IAAVLACPIPHLCNPAGLARAAKLLSERSLHARPGGHPRAMIKHSWKPRRIDSIRFEPLREREKIRVAYCVALSHDPGSLKHGALDQIETLAHRRRNLLLHRFDRSGIVYPTITAHAMRVRHVHG